MKQPGRVSRLTDITNTTDRAHKLQGWCLLLILALSISCAPKDPYVERGLESLGEIDLAVLSPEARAEIEERRSAIEERLADKSSDAQQIAESFGELAVLYGEGTLWEASRLCYANASTLQPDETRWSLGEAMMRGGAAFSEGDWDTADSAYREVLESDPFNLAAFRGLATARRQMGDLTGAYEVVRAGLQTPILEDQEGAENAVAERAALFVQLGDLEFRRGADEEGINALASSLELDGTQANLVPKIADALVRLGRLEGAVAQFEGYLKAVPSDVGVREKYATVLINLGEAERAIEQFRQAIETSEGDVALEMRFVAALQFLDRGDEAAEVEAAVRQRAATPEDKAFLAILDGDRLLQKSAPAAAESHYREAINLDSNSAAARLRLARALGQQERWDDAARTLEELLSADPRHREAQRARIMVLILGKRYDQARDQLQAALKEYPRDVELALTQVRLLATVPDPEIADGDMALAIAQRVYENLKNESSLEALALALAASGDHPKAVEAQQALIDATQQGEETDLARIDEARLNTFQRNEGWIARVPAEILVDLGL